MLAQALSELLLVLFWMMLQLLRQLELACEAGRALFDDSRLILCALLFVLYVSLDKLFRSEMDRNLTVLQSLQGLL